ncbi:MAG: SDR family oxidoreductase [Chloroflexi bacterium]|nr:SDR family oxidoreductase [Chloroflexota bacterium]
MTRFLVTGASGLLGLNFSLAVDGKKHQITGVDHRNPLKWINFKTIQADLTEKGKINRIIDEIKPDVILHCAAMANIDDCEIHPQAAEKTNQQLPGEIAAIARRCGVKMIHISTDAVFDGIEGNYQETDVPAPLSVYARTKFGGERSVLEENPDAIVARVNFYGWSLSGKRSLAEWFVDGLVEGKKLKGFTDILFCPMMVLDLAATLLEISEKDLKGLYHCVGPVSMSKYDFGIAIAKKFQLDPALVIPTSVLDGGLTAQRSPNLTLLTEKLTHALGHPLPSFEEGLKKFYDQYRHGFPEMIRSLA